MCVDYDFSELTNWGCSKEIFVYSIDNATTLVKEYFNCPAGTQMAHLLNIYASIEAGEEPNYNSILLENHIHLNKNKRNVSVFSKTSEL